MFVFQTMTANNAFQIFSLPTCTWLIKSELIWSWSQSFLWLWPPTIASPDCKTTGYCHKRYYSLIGGDVQFRCWKLMYVFHPQTVSGPIFFKSKTKWTVGVALWLFPLKGFFHPLYRLALPTVSWWQHDVGTASCFNTWWRSTSSIHSKRTR